MKYIAVLVPLLAASSVESFLVAKPASHHSRRTPVYSKKKSKSSRPPPNHTKWQPFYDALGKFHEEKGHCRVTEEDDESLYKWVEEQLKGYQALQAGRKTKLTRKRATALEQLGAIPPELM